MIKKFERGVKREEEEEIHISEKQKVMKRGLGSVMFLQHRDLGR